jgi:hypothetical protein
MQNLNFCLCSKLIHMGTWNLLIIPATESARTETPSAGAGLMSDFFLPSVAMGNAVLAHDPLAKPLHESRAM